MSSELKCWPGVRVSQYWPAESLSITFKPAELLRARQDGRGRWTVTRLSPDSWPVSKATKAQIAVTTECRHFDWRCVKKKTLSSQWNLTKESPLRPRAPGEETRSKLHLLCVPPFLNGRRAPVLGIRIFPVHFLNSLKTVLETFL